MSESGNVCVKGKIVSVLRESKGNNFYLGTLPANGVPGCKLSSETRSNRRLAIMQLKADLQDSEENVKCNKCGKCFK